MTEQEAINRMVAPGTPRPGKYRQGVIQIHVTRSCDKSCFNCTQGSNLAGKLTFMTPEQFDQACQSLKGYFGVVGLFGGNPAVSPYLEDYCEIIRRHFPRNQCGIWSNNPLSVENAKLMQRTFDPAVSNLNVHLDEKAYRMFKQGWPECSPVGLREDSRHSPVYTALKDVLKKDCSRCGGCGRLITVKSCWAEERNEDGEHFTCPSCSGTGKVSDESRAWELISNCDINKHWSAGIGVFRGQLRAWFCEIAMAQSILHQDEPDYPDTGLCVVGDVDGGIAWWRQPMTYFRGQVRQHCHDCGVPLRGHGAMAQGDISVSVCPRCEGSGVYQRLGEEPKSCSVCDGKGGVGPNGRGVELPREQVSATHEAIYRSKRKDRRVELVTVETQLGDRLGRMTDYLGNARRP